MKFRSIMLGVAVLLSPELACAGVVFDSVNIGPGAFNGGLNTTNTSWDWIDPSANGPAASQFTLTSAQTLTSVSLVLSADAPQDGGSVKVLLLQDSAGSPAFASIPDGLSQSGQISTFTGGTLLGTILDSDLAQNSALVTLNTSLALAAGSYWIGLETSNLPGSNTADDLYGSAQWWWSNPDPSNPATLNFNSIGTIGAFAVGGLGNSGDYELMVNAVPTSEPTTLAILGGGFAGIGYMRYRQTRKR